MLPFLKNSKEASGGSPAEPISRKPDEESDYDMLEAAAEDLISAMHSKNVKATCEALRAAIQLCDMEPHEEGEHV